MSQRSESSRRSLEDALSPFLNGTARPGSAVSLLDVDNGQEWVIPAGLSFQQRFYDHFNYLVGPPSHFVESAYAQRWFSLSTRNTAYDSSFDVVVSDLSDDLLCFAENDKFELCIGPAADLDKNPRDLGIALLEPITTAEYQAVEAILTELWRWIDVGNLSAVQQQQIMAMSDLIRQSQLDAQPGSTERWQSVGPTRTALRVLAKDVPTVVGGWAKVIDLLYKVRWSKLADALSDIIS